MPRDTDCACTPPCEPACGCFCHDPVWVATSPPRPKREVTQATGTIAILGYDLSPEAVLAIEQWMNGPDLSRTLTATLPDHLGVTVAIRVHLWLSENGARS